MGTVYNSMNDDIKAFGVWVLEWGQLRKAPEIIDIYSYNHELCHLHHYIKAQDYKRNMGWYEQNGIKEKLILLPVRVHEHLEDPIFGLSERAFLQRYKIDKNRLLFNKRKWIDNACKNKPSVYNFD